MCYQKENETDGVALDSLLNQDDFGEKLQAYISKYPLNRSFHNLIDSGLGISTSIDGRLRIYFWDDCTGGLQRNSANIVQYKTDKGIKISVDIPTTTYGSPADYYKINQFVLNNKTYYLVTYESLVAKSDYFGGVIIFAIKNDTLNTSVKLIKIKTGLHSQLNYECYPYFDGPAGSNWNIVVDPKLKTITLPLVDADKHLTEGFIVYKFTGQYFERVKN